MTGLLRFDDATERNHLSSIYALLLDRSFDGEEEFDHAFMSAGEALGQSLDHFGAVEWRGSSIVLTMSEREIMAKIAQSPAAELPLLTDALDVLLMFLGQYGTTPKLTNPFRFAEFDIGVSPMLRGMGLLDAQHVAHPSFWPYLVDHYLLKPDQDGWNAELRDALSAICDMTWASAPQDFKAVIEGQSARPVTWAEGYLKQRWRQGHWLTTQEQARSFQQGHAFLPVLVCRTLMAPDGEVYVPPGFRKAR